MRCHHPVFALVLVTASLLGGCGGGGGGSDNPGGGRTAPDLINPDDVSVIGKRK